jgi:hypothetical protein
MEAGKQTPAKPRGVGLHDWWLLLPPLSIGLFTWAAFLYIGIKAHKRSWLIAAGIYLSALFVAFGVDAAAGEAEWSSTLAGLVLFALAGGGLAHAVAVRSSFNAAIGGGEIESEYDAAERRLAAREEGRKIAAEDPDRARQLGIGRPDLKNSFDAELVDLNSAPPEVIASVTGVSVAVASRIVAAQDEMGDFNSVEDLDLLVDLALEDVTRLKDAGVCVPSS